MVSISGKPDLSADGADRVIAAAEPLYADLRWGLAAGFFAPVFLASGRVLPTLTHTESGCFGGASSKRVAEQPTAPGLLRWLVGPGP